jgi:hypothetical protein
MKSRFDDKDDVMSRGREMDHTSLLLSTAAPSSNMSTRIPYDSEDIAEGPNETQQDMELIGGQRVFADPRHETTGTRYSLPLVGVACW